MQTENDITFTEFMEAKALLILEKRKELVKVLTEDEAHCVHFGQ